MPSSHRLDVFDGQHAAADLGLPMPSFQPLLRMPYQWPRDTIVTPLLALSGSGIEVHPSEVTERSFGGCFLAPLVLVATSNRTREHLVLRKNLILFIFS